MTLARIILVFNILLFIVQDAKSQIHLIDSETGNHVLASITINDVRTTDSIIYIKKYTKMPLNIQINALNYIHIQLEMTAVPDSSYAIMMKRAVSSLETVEIKLWVDNKLGTGWLKPMEGTTIYAGKKTSLIQPDFIAFNKATNSSRQVFAKVPGLHIWESDGGGLQMGVGGRGLSPNRNANFNTRQNGYDIAADALGYPESYYTPPIELVERIELIRGASSLQFGTQFGGLLNFVLKKGNTDSRMKITHRNTGGSWFLFNTFTSISGGTSKFSYYTSYQFKRGNNKRPNSKFNSHTTYTSLSWKPNDKWIINADYTHMSYLAQQPGGLTDAQFEQNPWQSFRARNWFKVWWNLVSLGADYKLNDRSSFHLKTFGLIASRDAVGILNRINETDRGQERDLLKDNYKNVGAEFRYIHHYPLLKNNSSLLTGLRAYSGNTDREQGFANTSNSAEFTFLNPENPGISSFVFPNLNFAWFAENIFNLPQNIQVIPGIRIEYLQTKAKGNYNLTTRDLAGNIIRDTLLNETINRGRMVYLAGIGLDWKPLEQFEVYGNFSQNYRSITFSDLRVANPNLRVDPNLQDEKGFTTDIGVRGKWNDLIRYDASLFFIQYDNRIGTILRNDDVAPFLPYRYRTNIGKSISTGIEVFGESNLLKWFNNHNGNFKLNAFVNASYTYARYIKSIDPSIVGKTVEYVPFFMGRCGLECKVYDGLIAIQGSYVSKQFSDASNAIRSSTAVNGIIPGDRKSVV